MLCSAFSLRSQRLSGMPRCTKWARASSGKGPIPVFLRAKLVFGVLLPVLKLAYSSLAFLTTTSKKLKNANGQETNPTERAKPVEQCTHTSSGFPNLFDHLRRFFRHFVPLHDFVNVGDAPRNPLAQDWLWRVLAHCPRLPFESSLWSATIPRRGLLAGLSGKPTPNIGRMRADWHGSWRRNLSVSPARLHHDEYPARPRRPETGITGHPDEGKTHRPGHGFRGNLFDREVVTPAKAAARHFPGGKIAL